MRGERVLFRGVDIELSAGDAIALRGRNGAGKTTLLRMLAGLTRPEAGDIIRRQAHHWIGHKEGIKPSETPRTHLELWSKAWGAQADISTTIARMALSKAADVPGRYLSAGQRRRTALARLLLEQRPVWLLDEPYTALDTDGKKLLDTLVTEHRAAGGGLIVSLHDQTGFPVTTELTL